MSTEHIDDIGSWLDEIEVKKGPARDATHFRQIIAARKELEAAEREVRVAKSRLQEAVDAARAAEESWTVIGAALDTSRQAAQQRFGKSKRQSSSSTENVSVEMLVVKRSPSAPVKPIRARVRRRAPVR